MAGRGDGVAAPADHAVRGGLDESLATSLDALRHAGLERRLRECSHRDGATLVANGRRVVDFASNDYLGLASDRRIAAAASNALASGGVGGAAARLISGNHPLHTELERALASFKRTDRALLFSSGYAANTGAIPALVGRRDVVYSDELNHASLIDGARLSRAEVRTFPHRDIGALARMLHEDAGHFRQALIVVDAVFSMDGDTFPLDELVALAREHGAWTYVDDAHGTGVLGDEGRGTLAAYGVEGEIDVVMATLGKALGTAGAFIAGSRTLIEFLLHRARTFVYTTASPPALAAAALEALRVASAEPWRRDAVRSNAHRVRAGLATLGVPAPGPADGHIVPVVLGSAARASEAGDLLFHAGFLVGAVRPPTVPPGTARLRLSVSAAHTAVQIDALLDALAAVLP